ncbi:iron-sulfur cluster assembly scaffold protein [Mycoplasma sp. Mirounga ES2805-ORL]|uniref:iron-sulfur cluster assembly scaffold protein n=1 Tax=Mycoplasma sp. Mirounga ES2805-ORL TaxID=754514 RepID=UPI00197B9ED9|nr:iron-sulfur cluster assembly scaffold protein [Mycoplasma sp. Mirounga ES2805-ORL]QSF13708.1 iron-sulfur cluster assembly scaffold protein [Mycoplasma sp. Mirounga ES2805-ORL]
MSYSINEKQNLIFSHYSEPVYKDNHEHTNKVYGISCADYLEYDYSFENNLLKTVNFSGSGCAFYVASTDLVISNILNKNKEEIIYFIDIYEKFINGENLEQNDLKLLKELAVFDNVYKQENRKNCALMFALDFRNRIKNE